MEKKILKATQKYLNKKEEIATSITILTVFKIN